MATGLLAEFSPLTREVLSTRSAAHPRIAVVLAAGRGSRLEASHGGRPKASLRVLGVPLADRLLRGFDSAGIDSVVVVLGNNPDETRECFAEPGTRQGISVEFVTAQYWERGNGVSALAAERVVRGDPFLLTMADHVFEPALISRVANTSVGHDTIGLAVDRHVEALFDVDDATKVITGSCDAIYAVGKQLPSWDAVDTGAFHCTSAMFDALAEAQSQGRWSLSDAVSLLAADRRAHVIDVSGLLWADVDTPTALAGAERRFRRTRECRPDVESHRALGTTL